jgi:hypothetical protein
VDYRLPVLVIFAKRMQDWTKCIPGRQLKHGGFGPSIENRVFGIKYAKTKYVAGRIGASQCRQGKRKRFTRSEKVTPHPLGSCALLQVISTHIRLRLRSSAYPKGI